jgi:hypothetical protein
MTAMGGFPSSDEGAAMAELRTKSRLVSDFIARQIKMLAKTKGSNVIRGPTGKSGSIRSDRALGYRRDW